MFFVEVLPYTDIPTLLGTPGWWARGRLQWPLHICSLGDKDRFFYKTLPSATVPHQTPPTMNEFSEYINYDLIPSLNSETSLLLGFEYAEPSYKYEDPLCYDMEPIEQLAAPEDSSAGSPASSQSALFRSVPRLSNPPFCADPARAVPQSSRPPPSSPTATSRPGQYRSPSLPTRAR